MRLSDYNTPLSGMLAANGITNDETKLIKHSYTWLCAPNGELRICWSEQWSYTRTENGYGVQTLGVDRITDEVKTKQFNDQLSQLSYYNYKNSVLSRVESMVGTTGKTHYLV